MILLYLYKKIDLINTFLFYTTNFLVNYMLSSEKIYVKITNTEECHNNFQYQTGLNVLDKPFEKEGSCVPGGLYFTDLENVNNFYSYGVWLRIVKIPDDAQVVEDPDDSFGKKWRSDKLIFCEKYSLYNVNTIKKFKLQINRDLLEGIFKYGYVETLEWLKNNYKISDFGYDSYNFIHSVCQNGHIHVLDWWLKSGLPLQYKYLVLDWISGYGHLNMLDWFINSGLELEYTEDALSKASGGGHIHVLDWWLKSGLELKYNENAIYLESINGHVNVLEWWFKSGLPIKFPEKALDTASFEGHVNVLEWWFKSGLPLKYTENALDRASFEGHVDVLNKWFASGLKLKYTLQCLALISQRSDVDINVLDCWIKSGQEPTYATELKCRILLRRALYIK